MSSPAPGRINVFGLDSGRGLVWKYKGDLNIDNLKFWSDYHGKGGKWLFDPVSVSRTLDEISVFMVGQDGSLQQSNFDLVNIGDLGPWTNLGGKLSSPPAITKREEGILHIFHIDGDQAIHHRSWNGVVYRPAKEHDKLDGKFIHTPTAVSTGPDDVSVFAIGLDNHLYRYQWQSATGWSSKEKLPGYWTNYPKAVSDKLGSIDVFGIGAGGNITHIFCRNGEDWKLDELEGTFLSLDAIALGSGSVDLFALGDSKTIFHRTRKDGKWKAWEDLKGMMTQPPTAVSYYPDVVGVLSLGQGGVLYFKARNVKTGSWSEWNDLKGILTSRVG